MNEPAYHATLQHIQLLAAKQAKLEAAQLAAEEQLVTAIAREFNAGRVSYDELARVYTVLRGDERRPRFLPGFPTKRWRPVLPDINAINAALRLREASIPQGWHGAWPLEDAAFPAASINVVYVLLSDDLKPCYVGSTSGFKGRLTQHAKDGKIFSHWQAFKCENREHAYQVEERFLREFMPHLNKRRGR